MKQAINYFESSKVGKGMPYEIVNHEDLMKNDHVFQPSLRDFHVIFWFKKGRGNYYIDFVEHEIEPNTIILISKDYLHYFKPFDPTECELQSIPFKPEFLYKSDVDLQNMFKFNVGSHYEGIQLFKPNTQQTAFLNQISEQMFEIKTHWDQPQQSHGFYHLLSLFLTQCELIGEQKDIEEKSPEILQFNQLLEDHFKQEAKVEFYASKMFLSNKVLGRIVKQQYNKTPKTVIDERRTLEIKRLLQGSQLPIKEISYELGFDEPTNMVKFFKKMEGMTPKEFRNQ